MALGSGVQQHEDFLTRWLTPRWADRALLGGNDDLGVTHRFSGEFACEQTCRSWAHPGLLASLKVTPGWANRAFIQENEHPGATHLFGGESARGQTCRSWTHAELRAPPR